MGLGCILQHYHPLSVTVGGDILCCHLPFGFLTGPLYEEGERGPFRGLLVLVVIDTTPIIPTPRGP